MTPRAWLGAVLGLALVAGPARAQTLPTSEDCRSCHLELEDERLAAPARAYEADVHAETGFGCLACHGSGGQDVLDPDAGFLGVPTRREIPTMCGRCHSDAAYMRQFNPGLRVDQVTEYWTSGHGQRLRERNDPDVATCIDCHPAHEIRPPSDPTSTTYPANLVETCGRCHADEEMMQGRGIGTQQVSEYTASVHGRMLFEEGDVTAPVCNDCHGNHGAAPPGLGSIRSVCGQCHSVMADYFDQSRHAEIFDERGLPGCALCHDRHAIEPTADELLNDRSAEVCLDCHEPTDSLGTEFLRMSAALDSLRRAEERGRRTLEEAENLGMEVSQALFGLEEVNNVRTRARSAVHTFQLEPVMAEVTAGVEIAGVAQERGLAALAEHRFRRVGLGVFAGIVLVLVLGLGARIRDTEERFEELTESVRAFHERALSVAGTLEPTPDQLRLAACALLVEASYAHPRITDGERRHLGDLLTRRFDLPPSDAEALIDLAERQRERTGDVGRLSALIATDFTAGQKTKLLEELWRLVYGDVDLIEREAELLETVAHLARLGRAEVAAARRGAIVERLGAEGA